MEVIEHELEDCPWPGTSCESDDAFDDGVMEVTREQFEHDDHSEQHGSDVSSVS